LKLTLRSHGGTGGGSSQGRARPLRTSGQRVSKRSAGYRPPLFSTPSDHPALLTELKGRGLLETCGRQCLGGRTRVLPVVRMRGIYMRGATWSSEANRSEAEIRPLRVLSSFVTYTYDPSSAIKRSTPSACCFASSTPTSASRSSSSCNSTRPSRRKSFGSTGFEEHRCRSAGAGANEPVRSVAQDRRWGGAMRPRPRPPFLPLFAQPGRESVLGR
jgi:hypothetical protein